MIAEIKTPGTYTDLVDASLVREALNLEDNSPSNAALLFRIEEAARRIEGLTRLVLAESVWEYEIYREHWLEHGTSPDTLRIPGLFEVGTDPTVAVTDDDGASIEVVSKVQGQGEEILVQSVGASFVEEWTPIKVTITRGVTKEHLPADLRSAIVTQVEQLLDGFNSISENSIIRTCSRYGWVG